MTAGVLTDAQISVAAQAAGFRGGALITAVAIALAESGGVPVSYNTNKDGSTDVGLWQINDHAHPEYFLGDGHQLSPVDPVTGAKAAYKISRAGLDWGPWTTYDPTALHPKNNGRYRQFMARAAAVVNAKASDPANDPAKIPANPSMDPGRAIPQGITGGIATGVVGAVASPLEALGGLAVWLGNGHNWLRVVEVIGGAAAVLLALKMLADTGVGGPVGAVARGGSHVTHAAGKVAKTATAAALV